MWEFLVRQLLKQAGRKIGSRFFNDEANAPEAYADRIKRDFHLHDYADAWALYDSNRAYWERYYDPPPSGPDRNQVLVRDSAAAAGVPSRYNVFEFGFPEAGLTPDHSEPFNNRFGKWASSPGRVVSQSPLGLSDSFGDRFGNWVSTPADDFDNSSPVLRALENYRRSMAPGGSTLTSAQGETPPIPAFQPNAVYSPAGDFYANFPGVSADAAAPSTSAFNALASGFDPRTADGPSALAQRLAGLFKGAGQSVGDGPVSPAEAAPLSRLVSGPTAPDLSDDEAPTVVRRRPERYLSRRASP
jgi:hypothetical protein